MKLEDLEQRKANLSNEIVALNAQKEKVSTQLERTIGALMMINGLIEAEKASINAKNEHGSEVAPEIPKTEKKKDGINKGKP